tara:strand:- start:2688 stop:3134 length:447 start_codon:yes stop_codon:yes gene_type:complete
MPKLKPNCSLSSTPSDFWAQLGVSRQSGELIKQVREGFAFSTLTRLATLSRFSTHELAKMIGLSCYALRHARQLGRLSTLQSDRLVQVARVIGAACDLFEGDQVSANQWLMTAQRGLGGCRPVEMLATGVEVEAVLDLIGRIEHGVVS